MAVVVVVVTVIPALDTDSLVDTSVLVVVVVVATSVDGDSFVDASVVVAYTELHSKSLQ